MTTNDPALTRTTSRPLGFSVPALFGLALLGLPRVILHDLRVIEEGSPITWLLALGPLAVWIAVAVAKRVSKPFLTLLVVGAIFGVMLMVTHQILWVSAYAGNPPALGEGPLASLLPRLASIPSGIIVGTAMGAISGLIAWAVQKATGRTATPGR